MRLALLSCIVFVCCVNSALSRSKGNRFNRSPVILIPGYGGNRIEAKLNKKSAVPHKYCLKKTLGYIKMYLEPWKLKRGVIDCWIDNMKLHYDNVSRTTKNTVGVDIRVPGWGDPSYVEYLKFGKVSPGFYFKDIANMLVKDLGYVRKVSLRGAPYDFRKAPNELEEYFVKLKELVKETYKTNDAKRVTLISFGNGGLMSTIFLQRQSQEWKDTHINSLITLGASWGGSVETIKVFPMGEDFGTSFLNAAVKDLIVTFPSLNWQLPSKLFWSDSEILVESEKRNYTVRNLQQFLTDINVPNGWEFQKDNEKYRLNFTAPGVEVHCLHGVNVPTVERLHYLPGIPITGIPKIIFGEGDGTVNLKSLKGCLQWQGEQGQKIYHKLFQDVKHMGTIRSPQVLDYIKTILQTPV